VVDVQENHKQKRSTQSDQHKLRGNKLSQCAQQRDNRERPNPYRFLSPLSLQPY
jgi:hypothetical protein